MHFRPVMSDGALTVTKVLIPFFALFSACSDSATRQNDTAAANSGTPADAVAGSRSLVPTNGDPISALLSGPVSAASLARAPNTGKIPSPHRRCVGDSSPIHTDECVLSIELLAEAQSFDPNNIPAGGIRLAIVRNEGTKDEYRFDLERGKEYLWVVLPGVRPRSYFVNTGDPADRRPRGRPMFLHYCVGDKHGGAKLGWYCCNGVCPTETDRYPGGVLEKFPKRQTARGEIDFEEHTTPPWISCALGCCYAEF